jgi:hypothetical protein
MAVLSLSAAMAEIKANPGKIYVYTLSRPDGTPFYVGVGIKGRVAVHEYYARKNLRGHKHAVVRKIISEGHSIGYELLFLVNRDEAFSKEKELITLHGRHDLGRGPLMNLTDGGEGNVGIKRSPEYLAKLSLRMKAKVVSPEGRKRISAAVKALWSNPEYRKKSAAAMKAAKNLPESRAKMSAIMKGRKLHSPESKRKISEANRKMRRTPEQRARYSEAVKLVWSDPEMRARKVAAAIASGVKRRGEKQTDEHRAKVSAALKARGISPEHRTKLEAARRANREMRISARQ